MTDPLAKLFGSQARLKLLRLFLFNPLNTFTLKEAASRTELTPKEVRGEVEQLVQGGILKRNRRGKYIRFEADQTFPYILPLQNLLLSATSHGDELYARLKKTGNLKLIIMTGMFMGEWDSGLDLLVAGDKIRERAFRKQIKKFEAEIGREIRYTLFNSHDFLNRLNMSDRLMRDLFDFPHKIVLDKLDIGLK